VIFDRQSTMEPAVFHRGELLSQRRPNRGATSHVGRQRRTSMLSMHVPTTEFDGVPRAWVSGNQVDVRCTAQRWLESAVLQGLITAFGEHSSATQDIEALARWNARTLDTRRDAIPATWTIDAHWAIMNMPRTQTAWRIGLSGQPPSLPRGHLRPSPSQRFDLLGTPTGTDGDNNLLAQRIAQEIHAAVNAATTILHR
jgi:hypothetical protein